jgi:hypothetical protein
MPNRPTRTVTELPLSRQEWDLLTRLPRRVLVAATSAEPDSARHTVAEGLAGIEAIAAGRTASSALVRAVVAEIYAEVDGDDEHPVAEEFTQRAAGIAAVLGECRTAARVLADRTTPADAKAYRDWLEAIATAVCAAARTGGLLGVGGVAISAAERQFLDELHRALTP